jgi:hypothetical protein
MKNAISYALFGMNRTKDPNCFGFDTYLRGLMMNIRLNRLLFPGWDNVLNMDNQSYQSFKPFFDQLKNLPNIRIDIQPDNDPLCMAMLWRLKPVFLKNSDGSDMYERVLCRDLDSPPTYRERQCVQMWIDHDKTMHAITDSISHSIPLMGGMIGIKSSYFKMRVAASFENLMALDRSINYKSKGTDQTFLNKIVYPKVAKHGDCSITQHYMLGHGDTFLMDYHNSVPQIIPVGVEPEMEESNNICGHIGSAGAYMPALERFLSKYRDRFLDINAIEQLHPEIFYWIHKHIF